jgi:hypothetical protein
LYLYKPFKQIQKKKKPVFTDRENSKNIMAWQDSVFPFCARRTFSLVGFNGRVFSSSASKGYGKNSLRTGKNRVFRKIFGP